MDMLQQEAGITAEQAKRMYEGGVNEKNIDHVIVYIAQGLAEGDKVEDVIDDVLEDIGEIDRLVDSEDTGDE